MSIQVPIGVLTYEIINISKHSLKKATKVAFCGIKEQEEMGNLLH